MELHMCIGIWSPFRKQIARYFQVLSVFFRISTDVRSWDTSRSYLQGVP